MIIRQKRKINLERHCTFKLLYRYKKWLPDNVVGRHDTKTTYQVEIRYANNTNETFTFHGPPGKKVIFRLLIWYMCIFYVQ